MGHGRIVNNNDKLNTNNRSKSRVKNNKGTIFNNSGNFNTRNNNFLRPINEPTTNLYSNHKPPGFNNSMQYNNNTKFQNNNFMNKQTDQNRILSPKKELSSRSKTHRSPEPNPPPKKPILDNHGTGFSRNNHIIRGDSPKNAIQNNKLFDPTSYTKNRQHVNKDSQRKNSHSKNNEGVDYMEKDYEKMNIDNLNTLHERLINKILTEEEEIINSHRSHIDIMFDFSKKVLFC